MILPDVNVLIMPSGPIPKTRIFVAIDLIRPEITPDR
jgi:hypothetical protein